MNEMEEMIKKMYKFLGINCLEASINVIPEHRLRAELTYSAETDKWELIEYGGIRITELLTEPSEKQKKQFYTHFYKECMKKATDMELERLARNQLLQEGIY